MTAPLLRLDHVTKTFGPVTVIDDVSVDVLPGRVQCCSVRTVQGSPHSSR